ncbi:hypothetical protein BUALT_Bualt15G0093400 [Buddleja alternifolia]|uniref:Uncharacterized protein n=1 Tax=Buddleja alternifolia TaxID=168488 RepID=A0AAV6WPQ9_9LAMI|nr:hypothetical protein BUALT_Bualt15G0093400 [Buddleja alternifolia]
MPLNRFVADALGVVTISLVALLLLVGLFCILYSFYFRSRIRGQNLVQLNYFSGPWIIRIAYIFFAVWWGVGEIIRLNLLRRKGRVLDALTLTWQENVCKCYIVSNLGFAEPCLFLTLVFLLRASLQRSGTLSRKWNMKTAGFILLYCFPVFILQLLVILLGPKYKKDQNPTLPSYFINAASTSTNDDVTLCTYPLLSTIFLGLFASILTAYLFWLGRRILHLVINKGLQKRVYTLIFSICSFFPLRVILLGLSVLPEPEKPVFDAIAFLAFLSILCCAGIGICMLVYLPIADSLSLRSLQRDIEARRGMNVEYNDTISLIANPSPLDSSPERNSATSTKRGSISFRTMEKDEAAFVELNLFNPSKHSTPPGSPRLVGWPMTPTGQVKSGKLNHVRASMKNCVLCDAIASLSGRRSSFSFVSIHEGFHHNSNKRNTPTPTHHCAMLEPQSLPLLATRCHLATIGFISIATRSCITSIESETTTVAVHFIDIVYLIVARSCFSATESHSSTTRSQPPTALFHSATIISRPFDPPS